MTAPKWAVNAANRFVVPLKDTSQIVTLECAGDVEKFHAALVALQLRAYRRGKQDGALIDTAAMNREARRNELAEQRGKTAGDGK